jgi:hypothetical protein
MEENRLLQRHKNWRIDEMIYLMKCKNQECEDDSCSHKNEHELNEGCSHACHWSFGEKTCTWTNATRFEKIKLHIKDIYHRAVDYFLGEEK